LDISLLDTGEVQIIHQLALSNRVEVIKSMLNNLESWIQKGVV